LTESPGKTARHVEIELYENTPSGRSVFGAVKKQPEGLVAEVPENAEEQKGEIILYPLSLLFSAFLCVLSD
jgi:hypothetical protein